MICLIEDCKVFNEKFVEIGVDMVCLLVVYSVDEVFEVVEQIGYLVMMCIVYVLGGLGFGICDDVEMLCIWVEVVFFYMLQVFIEESLIGWKEVEYEVVCDFFDNCIIVCNMENLDLMGIYIGELIVVVLSQMFIDFEYYMLCEVVLCMICYFGVVGECNIQYVLDLKFECYCVIEVNVCLFCSLVLVLKVIGYLFVFVVVKFVLGQFLVQIFNCVIGVMSVCFELVFDYLVVKFLCWDFKKFCCVLQKFGLVMKFVGEVMVIGCNFEEIFQKVICMFDIGFEGVIVDDEFEDFDSELSEFMDWCVFVLVCVFQQGYFVDKVCEFIYIDLWFFE